MQTIIWVPGDLLEEPATAPADPEGEGVHLCGAIYLLSGTVVCYVCKYVCIFCVCAYACMTS